MKSQATTMPMSILPTYAQMAAAEALLDLQEEKEQNATQRQCNEETTTEETRPA